MLDIQTETPERGQTPRAATPDRVSDSSEKTRDALEQGRASVGETPTNTHKRATDGKRHKNTQKSRKTTQKHRNTTNIHEGKGQFEASRLLASCLRTSQSTQKQLPGTTICISVSISERGQISKACREG